MRTLKKLAEIVNGVVVGDANTEIHSAASLKNAQTGQISFLTSAAFKSYLDTTAASAIIVKTQKDYPAGKNFLVVDDPHLAYAKIANELYPAQQHAYGIDASATVHANATVHPNSSIGQNVVIEDGAQIEDGVCIMANSVIGANARIGENTLIYPNVTIYHEVEIGQRCIIHAGTVIGSDGFGFAHDNGKWLKIPQIGTVIIGDDVEIGANAAIDRGAIENTIIESGAKLDNDIHIAHNVQIGANTVIAAKCGFAGSAIIGKNCMFGGMVAVNGHLELADNVVIMGHSTVTKSIKEAGSYSSVIPVEPASTWARYVGRFKRLESLNDRVKQCEEKLKEEKD